MSKVIDGLNEVIESLEIQRDHKAVEWVKDAKKTIEDLEKRIAIMQEGGWHDAKTSQPKEDGDYLVCCKDGMIFCEYKNGQFGQGSPFDDDDDFNGWISAEEMGLDILYWIPMPEPPKEGEN